MNKYDPLLYFLLNRILHVFGISIAAQGKVKYVYKIPNYLNKEKTAYAVHVILLSENIADAFTFLKMNYQDYLKQEFKNIFEFSNYFVTNCPYLTKQYIQSIEKGMGLNLNDEDELKKEVIKFVKYVKLAHLEFREFNFIPIMMYSNLKESIVRKFFTDESVSKQFIDIKLRELKKVELPNKFSGTLVVDWIRPLKVDSTLCGLFTQSFVNYVTKEKPEHFPRYLIDKEKSIIKKEVITYYYEEFIQSEIYESHRLELENKNTTHVDIP